jgi:hypothetical protein
MAGRIQRSSKKQADESVITTLTADAADQSVLLGILGRIRDLKIFLLSVTEDGLEI